MKAAAVAVGVRVKSGWATGVLVAGPASAPHALEGALFRTALAAALDSQGVPCSVVVEREAYARAAALLKRTEGQLRRAVTDLGRSLEGPWRADEKTAALAAWMALRRR